MLQMEMMIASLIHNFYLESVDYIKEIRFQVDIIVHPHPLRVRFVPVLQLIQTKTITNHSFDADTCRFFFKKDIK